MLRMVSVCDVAYVLSLVLFFAIELFVLRLDLAFKVFDFLLQIFDFKLPFYFHIAPLVIGIP